VLACASSRGLTHQRLANGLNATHPSETEDHEGPPQIAGQRGVEPQAVEIGEGGTFMQIHPKAEDPKILYWGFDYLPKELAHQTVMVAGRPEVWELVWDGKPRSICGPDDPVALTCPCMGFAYGEMGTLSLKRIRNGHETEQLNLGPFFDDQEHPSEQTEARGKSYLQRWPIISEDANQLINPSKNFALGVSRRFATQTMKFADYDHDGSATEFLLQVGTLPCGKRQYMAVGTSKAIPHLHALNSASNPTTPLVLPAQVWQALLDGNGTHSVTTWACGDHGSYVLQDVLVSAENGSIHVTNRKFGCTANGDRGELQSQLER
jgi:hypothetical protein